jgi:hypothetical protein
MFISKLRTKIPGKTLVAAVGLAVMSVFQAGAVPVTVQDLGMGAHEEVNMTSSTLGTHWVYAGTINLLVDGKATQGFCIDPFNWSITGPQAYNSEPLANAPKAPINGMGAATALKIEQLYSHYFSPNMGNQAAAGLQIAIWELVGGSNFHLNSSPDYGASTMLTWVNSNPNAQAANLIAVTGRGQDYLIPSCPDAGETALMLGCGLVAMLIVRSKFLGAQAAK